MRRNCFGRWVWPVLLLGFVLAGCGGGSGASSGTGSSSGSGSGSSSGGGATRTFYLGTSPFFGTPRAYPDFLFENLDDKDLLSVHVDDFWGVPWDQCAGTACTNLPPAWTARWQALASGARASGKVLYLSVSPLGNRRTLAARVQADGSALSNWLPASVVDANGCYTFSTDAAQAARYATAYVNYVRYVVDLVQPAYLSPAIEMNMPFATCPAQTEAWIAWYGSVHAAIKAAYPALTVFPTFQLEFLYGSATPLAACAAGTSYTDCFSKHLAQALTIPGDRIAFSSYPESWVYSSAFDYSYPPDTFDTVRKATSRRIWISETGWNTVPLLNTYAHADGAICSATFLLPQQFQTPAGTVDVADDAAQQAYLSWLLGQARNGQFEAVIWWLNRDYLDGTVAGTCPCSPATSDTCSLANTFYAAGGVETESLLRIFGNMGLRRYDGTTRPAYTLWKQALALTRTP